MNDGRTANTTNTTQAAARRAKAGQRATQQTSQPPQQSTTQKPVARPRSPKTQANQQPLALGSTTFSPGQPLLPTPGLTGASGEPRQFAFPVGANIGLRPRATEQSSFEQLRNLAALYDGIQLCERVYFDLLGRLQLHVVPRREVLAEGEDGSGLRWQESARRIEDFLESPDRLQDLRSWLVAFVRDLLEIDAVTVYTRQTRGGKLYALELIDGACYASDVEVLTKAGWKPFYEVDLGRDLIATRNQNTKAFEWQKATYFHETDWDSDIQGNLYHFTSRSFDLLVTPNHRMLVNSLPRSLGGSRHRSGETVILAKDLAEHYRGATSIPATSEWFAEDVQEVRIPATTPRSREVVFSGDDFAAFMGMWIAEGCAPDKDQVYISQKPTSKGYEEYKYLLERIFGFSPCHTGTNFVIGHKALHDYLKQFGHAHEKFVPEIIKGMSRRQLEIFWHYYVLGDGHYKKSKDGTVHERIITVSKKLIGDLQEVLQKMGNSGSISTRHPTLDQKMGDGRIIKKENIRPAYILTRRTSTHHLFTHKRVPYNGKVYCLSVPNEILYIRRNGKPAWCGNTIKPLIDATGRSPQPPGPAFQQFLYGVPAEWYSLNEMDYLRKTARTESVYGLSRVERILLRVNQALRKQHFDLARFTDGTTPLGIIAPPTTLTWTPEQLETFERAFNGLLAGNDEMRVRARALPPGATWQALAGDDPLIEFDRFLLNVTVAAFGLTMDELGFTDTSNRSTGQTQESVVYRRAVAPVASLAAGYLTRKVRQWLDPRFTVSFGGIEEPEDFAIRAEAFAKLIPLGVLSPVEAARLLNLPMPGQAQPS